MATLVHILPVRLTKVSCCSFCVTSSFTSTYLRSINPIKYQSEGRRYPGSKYVKSALKPSPLTMFIGQRLRTITLTTRALMWSALSFVHIRREVFQLCLLWLRLISCRLNGMLSLQMLMHDACRFMECEFLLTKCTTYSILSFTLTTSTVFTIWNFFKVFPASSLLFRASRLRGYRSRALSHLVDYSV